jgi:hypothetical protein
MNRSIFSSDFIYLGYFYRNAIPTDLINLDPNPTGWGQPSAFLSPDNCNLSTYFANHSIVFGKNVYQCYFLVMTYLTPPKTLPFVVSSLYPHNRSWFIGQPLPR